MKLVNVTKKYFSKVATALATAGLGLLPLLAHAEYDTDVVATEIASGKTAIGVVMAAFLGILVFIAIYRKVKSSAR